MAIDIILSLCQLGAMLLLVSEGLVLLMANWMFVVDEQEDQVKQFLIGLAFCLIPVVTLPMLPLLVNLLYWLLPEADYSYLILSLVVLLTVGCLSKSSRIVVASTRHPHRCARLLATVFFGIPVAFFTALLLASWQYGGWVIAGCFLGIIPAVIRFIRRIQQDVRI